MRLGDLWADGPDTYKPFDAIEIAGGSYTPANTEGNSISIDSPTNLVHAAPGIERGQLRTMEYTPTTSKKPAYTGRLKRPASYVRGVFDRYS